MPKNNGKRNNNQPVGQFKEKPTLNNAMFHRTSHYLLSILIIITMAFLVFYFNDEIKSGGQQIKIYVGQQNQISLTNRYEDLLNNITHDYFQQINILKTKDNFWAPDILNRRKELTDKAIRDITDLKLADNYKDFHLSLLLIFNKISQSENDSNATLYDETQVSLESLAQQNQWFKY